MVNIEPKLISFVKQIIVNICNQQQGYLNCWPKLMEQLQSYLKNKNYFVSNEIYDLCRLVTKRYRYEIKSFGLFEEIKCTIKYLAQIMTDDALEILGILIKKDLTSESNDLILIYLKNLISIINLFHSINYQDFPEFFEDNLDNWMNIIKALLEINLPNKFLNNNFILENFLKLKTKTLRALNLYCNNYYDDFKNYHDSFIQPVWNLLLIAKNEEIFYKFTRELLEYYKVLYNFNRINSSNCNVYEISEHITQNLIIPNMKLTSKELDDFEDGPVNFLKIELEEVDMESNKYFAINVLKSIIQKNKEILDKLIRPLIDNLLNSYNQNPNKNWMDKIVAINLIFGSMIKTYASRYGAIEINCTKEELAKYIELIFINEFNDQNLLNISNLIPKIFSFKFLGVVRLQIPLIWIKPIINLQNKILEINNPVLSPACLLTLEKILYNSDPEFLPEITEVVNSEKFYLNIFGSLMNILGFNKNIFAIKCFLKICLITKLENLIQIQPQLSMSINNLIKLTLPDTSEEQFNFFLFEVIALLMRKFSVIPTDLVYFNNFFDSIKENFLTILDNNITDLLGFVFQILNLHLEICNKDCFIHQNLLNTLLKCDSNWCISMRYLFPAYLSYIDSGLKIMQNNLTIEVYNYLIILALKNYKNAFELINIIINRFNIEQITSAGLIENFIINLYSNYIQIKSEALNRKSYIEYTNGYFLLLAKILAKTNIEFTMSLLKLPCQDNYINLIIDFTENFIHIDGVENKKLSNFFFSNLMKNYFNIFSIEILKNITINMIKNLEMFNKGSLVNINDNTFDISNESMFNSNKFNVLGHARLPKEKLYSNIVEIDEKNLFYDAINSVRVGLGVNLITEVYESLDKRQRNFIQSTVETFKTGN